MAFCAMSALQFCPGSAPYSDVCVMVVQLIVETLAEYLPANRTALTPSKPCYTPNTLCLILVLA